MRHIAFVVVFLATSITYVCGQTASVFGTLSDQETGETVPFASVALYDSTQNVIAGTTTDFDGKYRLDSLSSGNYNLHFSYVGYPNIVVSIVLNKGEAKKIDQAFPASGSRMNEVLCSVAGVSVSSRGGRKAKAYKPKKPSVIASKNSKLPVLPIEDDMETDEGYKKIGENPWVKTTEQHKSTFSIDVDRASYSNIRRFLNYGELPPKDAVRIEEMVNYFEYDYQNEPSEHPFQAHFEMADGFWNPETKLLRIGIKGRDIDELVGDLSEAPNSNLVFLLDVSGSMSDANKLPLLKASLRMLLDELRPEDKVSIVVYAGAAGLVLPPTSGTDKTTILNALNKLEAGGSTAGGEGIKLAYKTAKDAFIEGGNNRVILATDGDFNVGVTSEEGLEKMIEKEREKGVFLTVLGFGMGNYKDDRLELLADKGNGNYAYIDNMKEAEKFLVREFASTMFTIAKDMKLQLVFNDKAVKSYRLVGYENRKMKNKDFDDDTKDAGELGAGHMVTAFYEIIPAQDADKESEWVNLRMRYKQPDGEKSTLTEIPFSGSSTTLEAASDDFKFAVAAAGWGMLLRRSKYLEKLSYSEVLDLAKAGKGEDLHGDREEMIRLIELSKSLDKKYSK